jgi:cell division protein FtsI (penicillin-binding protein 3)
VPGPVVPPPLADAPPADEQEVYDNLSPDPASSDFYETRINGSSNLVEGEQVPAPRRVLSPEVARTVRAMLAYTVDESGLSRAEIPGVEVAGKSGTADVFDLATGRYIEDDYNLAFAGMFPAERPDIVMVVTVKKPRLNSSSTYVAAPLFRAIGSEIVAGWGLAPSAPPVARTP